MINIAIDGPSGAGKSTVAKALAKSMDILYLDTGAMYRAVALKALRLGIDPCQREKVLPILNDTDVEVKYGQGVQHILVDGEDVSQAIREHRVSKAASDISKIQEVREYLVDMQRAIAKNNDVVLDGRDITSYVLKDTPYKFYLSASVDVRAKRRFDELTAKGQAVEYDKIKSDIIDRDDNDMKRTYCPLTRTADSIFIDSSDMTVDEVVKVFLKHIEEIGKSVEKGV